MAIKNISPQAAFTQGLSQDETRGSTAERAKAYTDCDGIPEIQDSMVTELLGFLKSSGTSTSQAARLWRNDWNIEDAGVEALVTSDPEHAHHVGFMRLIKDCLESNDPESMAHGDYDLFSKINQKDIC